MANLTTDKSREIINDFAVLIKQRRTKTARPEKTVIDFRDQLVNKIESDVWVVPIELLRFRKDNGRIASDVLSYEKNYGPLDEKDKDDQEKLGQFLLQKDEEKTKELKNSLLHGGQREAAIITCDGFLINGNRRKLALQELMKGHPGEPRFRTMKVVILPGIAEEGGPPTFREIEQIENRYQLQSDGKAEYYNFDRALSMRRKIDLGITLEEQLKDDPNCINLSPKEFKKKMNEVQETFLGPLECVDQYLEHLGRGGLYDTVSGGRADREGRWQAFLDYYKFYKKLGNEKDRLAMGIDEDEVGKFQDVAFKIIRKREIPGQPKVHMLMRQLPKLLENPDAKKELLQISVLKTTLPEIDRVDKDGQEYDSRTIDKIWGQKYAAEITRQVKRAVTILESSSVRETPLTLLESAFKKLNHDQLDLNAINPTDIPKSKDLIRSLRERINELEKALFRIEKNAKKEEKDKRRK